MPHLALHGERDTILPSHCSQRLALASRGSLQLLKHDTHRVESALEPVMAFILREIERFERCLGWVEGAEVCVAAGVWGPGAEGCTARGPRRARRSRLVLEEVA